LCAFFDFAFAPVRAELPVRLDEDFAEEVRWDEDFGAGMLYLLLDVMLVAERIRTYSPRASDR
jgi:hypothetical protein